jgi:hypothetical protein
MNGPPASRGHSSSATWVMDLPSIERTTVTIEMRNVVSERRWEAARRGRRRYDDRRLRLWLLEGGTVGIWSSALWWVEHI